MDEAKADLYRELDADIDGLLRADVGFTTLIASAPLRTSEDELAGFRARYERIKTFQATCRDLLRLSLEGDEDPEIAQCVVGEMPAHLAADYHRALTPEQDRTPVFFRTDESRSGRLSEIQCCGSGWGFVTQMQRLYRAHPEVFGEAPRTAASFPTLFKEVLERYVSAPPVLHHLVDNASRPHGIRYFIQRTREAGLRYFGYDRGIKPEDVNFLRAHDFISLPTHNFFEDRMARCARGSFFFDLPPSNLYDGKIILAWPFWEKTRAAFPDEVRALFPHTAVIEEDGIELEDGERVTLDQFASIPSRRRTWYLKYAGTDIGINWGSKAVHLASTLSQVKCREMLDAIVADRARGRYWIAQRAVRELEPMEVIERNGTLRQTEVYGKLSAFYGPEGLMAVLGMHRRSHKVHGSADTIISLAP